jgi:hypothetical protein
LETLNWFFETPSSSYEVSCGLHANRAHITINIQ